ncbi:MAG: hypothetical protein OXH99_11920 [Bryobacterales bacterium]|nr:hypothetical protein [Bryobacterales bacterium]
MADLLAGSRVNPLFVQNAIPFAGLGRAAFRPAFGKSASAGVPTLVARPVTRSQRHRFIEKEQHGVAPRLHERSAAVPEFQLADDPALVFPAAWTEASWGVMQNATIAHEQAARAIPAE